MRVQWARLRLYAHGLLLGVIGLVLLAGTVAAQPDVTPGQHNAADGSADTLEALNEGIDLIRSGRYEKAMDTLMALYQSDATYAAPEIGSVAYWLGRAYKGDGQDEVAHNIWRSAIHTLDESDRLPGIRLADAFVRSAAQKQDASAYGKVEKAYYRLLGAIDRSEWTSLSEEERERVRRHAREVAVVLPEDVQERTGLTVDRLNLEVSIEPTADAGAALAGWWRSKDSLPGSGRNERLQEHLQRVIYARENFESDGRLDDRGKVFIQLGEPREVTQARLSPAEEATPHLAEVRVRDNEFWTYPDVDRKAYFLFVDDGEKGYELGEVDTLFPPDVRTGIDRSFDRSLSYLEALQRVLRQLANYHGDFGLRASEAVDATQAALDQDEFGISAEENPAVTQRPGAQARELRLQNQQEDRANASDRADRVPSSYSTIGETAEELPVRTRVARFLTDDGDTRAEVAWGLDRAALQSMDGPGVVESSEETSEESEFLLRFSGLREGPDHVTEETYHQQDVVSGPDREEFQPKRFETTASDSVFHLAMQWDQYAFERREDDEKELTSVLRRQVERKDTLRALDDDPTALQMSDLQLLTVPEGKDPAAIVSDEAIVYPFEEVTSGDPLGLGFEIYHLPFDDNDLARYTVSYTAERAVDDGGFLGLFGGDDTEQVTTTATTTEAQSRTVEETILLDLEELAGDEPAAVDIAVRVTDEVTGQEIERDIEVELHPE